MRFRLVHSPSKSKQRINLTKNHSYYPFSLISVASSLWKSWHLGFLYQKEFLPVLQFAASEKGPCFPPPSLLSSPCQCSISCPHLST